MRAGVRLRREGNLQRAFDDFSEGLRIAPENAEILADVAFYYEKTSDFGKAVALYTKAIRIDPRYSGPYAGRGFCYYHMGDADKALVDCNKAIANRPAVPVIPGIIDTDMPRSCFGADAGNYPEPAAWAEKAVPFLLKLGPKDNGKPMEVPE